MSVKQSMIFTRRFSLIMEPNNFGNFKSIRDLPRVSSVQKQGQDLLQEVHEKVDSSIKFEIYIGMRAMQDACEELNTGYSAIHEVFMCDKCDKHVNEKRGSLRSRIIGKHNVEI